MTRIKLLWQAVCLIAFCLPLASLAQDHEHDHDHHFRECGADHYHEHLMQHDKNYREQHEYDEKVMYEYFKEKYSKHPLKGPVQRTKAEIHARSNRKTAAKYVIPVVVHVIHDGPVNNLTFAQISTGISNLNDYFRGLSDPTDPLGEDTEIEFCLASQDPMGAATTGVTYTNSPLTSGHVDFNVGSTHTDIRNLIRWPNADYLNIWVVRDIAGAAGFSPLGSQGGFFLQGGGFAGGYVLAHEAGHTLGMPHTFSGGCPNGDCLTSGDRICDTPPDDQKWGPCINNTCTSDDADVSVNNPYRPVAMGGLGDQNDHVKNVMDYSGSCGGRTFTAGQRDKMWWYLQNRLSSWVTSSVGCLPPCPAPITISYTLSDTIVFSGTPIIVVNTSVNAINHAWYVNGVLYSNLQNPVFNIPIGGIYTIRYEATNPANMSCDEDTTFKIEIVCPGLAPSFTQSHDTVISGGTATFTNTTVGGHIQYWYKDGVLFDSLVNGHFTFYRQGTYDITLRVIDTISGCEYSVNKPIVVTCPVRVNFDMSKDVITAPELITLTNLSTNATSFEWYIDAAFSSNTFHHSTFHGALGNQIVTLVADNGYCRDSMSRVISFIDPTACSQFEVNRWYFGGQAGMDFNGGAPVPVTDGMMNASEGSATISNEYGNLLFYSNGEEVWDAAHTVMTNGSGLLGDDDATQAALIVPVPGSTGRFYLFHMSHSYLSFAPYSNVSGSLYFSEVDMTLSAGLGDVVAATKNTLLSSNMTEKLAATRHADGCSYWITAHEYGTDVFKSYLLDDNGLDTVPVISSIGTSHGLDATNARGQMKFSPDGSRLGLITGSPAPGGQPGPDPASGTMVEVFAFDNLTGQVTAVLMSDISPMQQGYGAEFSPDNDKFYVTFVDAGGQGGPTFEMVAQYNIALATAAARLASKTFIASVMNIDCTLCDAHGLQLAPDNIIYHAATWSPSLHAITSPNTLGFGANHTTNYFGLGGQWSQKSLPGLISGSVGALDFTFNCTPNGVDFNFTSSIRNIETVLWEFGDGNTSNSLSPTHRYATNDTFDVTLTVRSMCQCATITKQIVCPFCTGGVGAPFSKISITPAGPVCDGTPLTFTAYDTTGGGSAPSFNWLLNGAATGSSGMTYGPAVLADGDSVQLVMTSSLCTLEDDTFEIVVDYMPHVTPVVSIRADHDTVCENESVNFVIRDSIYGGSDPSFQWYINGIAAGTDHHTLNIPAIQTGDSISVVMTSNELCPLPATASNGIRTIVLPADTPVVAISVSADSICPGDPVTVTIVDSTGGGVDPTFEWFINGVSVFGDQNSIFSTIFNNGDSIGVRMTSDNPCAPFPIGETWYVITVDGCSDSTDFTADKFALCVHDTVTFSGLTSGFQPSDSLRWDFGTGFTALDGDTGHGPLRVIYTTAGNKDIVLYRYGSTEDTVSKIAYVTVYDYPTAIIDTLPDSIGFCQGENVFISGQNVPGASYQWYFGGALLAGATNQATGPLVPGEYRIEVTLNGCTSFSDSIIAFETPNVVPAVTITADRDTICPGETINYTVTDSTYGGSNPLFRWAQTGITVGIDDYRYSSSSLMNGDSVLVEMTANNLCQTSNQIFSNVHYPVVRPLLGVLNPMVGFLSPCENGDTISLTTNLLGGNYNWSVITGDAALVSFNLNSAIIQPGSLNSEVIVSVLGICDTLIDTVTITPQSRPDPSFTINDDTICDGNSTTLNINTMTGGTTYSIFKDGTLFSTNPPVNLNQAGNYHVVAANGNCDSTASSAPLSVETVNITATANPTTIELGNTSQLIVSGSFPAGSNILWTPSNTLNSNIITNPVAAPDQTTSYSVLVTSPYGCADNAQVLVNVIKPLIIPTAISPNGGQENETWILDDINSFHNQVVRVYNRYGSLVHENYGYYIAWDGKRNGEPIPVGTYYYVIDVTDHEGTPHLYTGNLTILR